MAGLVSSTTMAQPSMNPASNPDTEHGAQLHTLTHDLPSKEVSGTGSNPDALVDEKVMTGVESPTQVREITGVRWVLVLIAILSSTFLFALDNTVVADVQPAIVETFGEIQKLPWLPIAFLVAAVSTNLIWGKIYGQLNAKWLYIFTTTMFELGSAICGASNSMNTLIVGRALAGLGGAGMYIGVMTLLSVTTTEHERPVYIGLTGLTWGLGTVLGPIIGGAFADSHVGWRYAFYINLFIFAPALPIYVFLLPTYDPRPGVQYAKRLRELDYVGTLLIIGACVSGVMGISFGGVIYAWSSGQTIALFIVSAILFVLFSVQQAFCIFTTLDQRIFPVHFLRNKTLIVLFMQTSAGVTTTFVPIYFIPLFFQFVRNDSALQGGVRLLPFIALMVLMVILNGSVMSKYGYYAPWYLFGGIFIVIGASLLFTVTADTSTSRIYGYTVLLGIGAGSYIQASFSVAQVKVPPSEIPLAIGFISMAQIGGATIALAIANSVFLNQATSGISALLPDVPFATVQGAVAGAGSTFFANLDSSVKSQVLQVLTASISRIYILSITAGALTICLVPLMSWEKLFLTPGAA